MVKRLRTEKRPVVVEIDGDIISIKDAETKKRLIAFRGKVEVEEKMLCGKLTLSRLDALAKKVEAALAELTTFRKEVEEAIKKGAP